MLDYAKWIKICALKKIIYHQLSFVSVIKHKHIYIYSV